MLKPGHYLYIDELEQTDIHPDRLLMTAYARCLLDVYDQLIDECQVYRNEPVVLSLK